MITISEIRNNNDGSVTVFYSDESGKVICWNIVAEEDAALFQIGPVAG